MAADILDSVRRLEDEAKRVVDKGSLRARELVAAAEQESRELVAKARPQAEAEARAYLGRKREEALAEQAEAIRRGEAATKALRQRAAGRIDEVARGVADELLARPERAGGLERGEGRASG